MTNSWRHILERAASNLSIELDEKAPAGFSNPAGWPAPARARRRTRSLAESRELLARELETIPAQAQDPARKQVKRSLPQQRVVRPSLNRAVLPREVDPPQAPAARPDRRLTALVISVAIVVLSLGAIYALLH